MATETEMQAVTGGDEKNLVEKDGKRYYKYADGSCVCDMQNSKGEQCGHPTKAAGPMALHIVQAHLRHKIVPKINPKSGQMSINEDAILVAMSRYVKPITLEQIRKQTGLKDGDVVLRRCREMGYVIVDGRRRDDVTNRPVFTFSLTNKGMKQAQRAARTKIEGEVKRREVVGDTVDTEHALAVARKYAGQAREEGRAEGRAAAAALVMDEAIQLFRNEKDSDANALRSLAKKLKEE